ncbi:MAG: hypothetical protein HKP01_08700 [Gemmatimonadetes bacterium]|nr:hypothetical protein [Gemmatimonadota bacterium]
MTEPIGPRGHSLRWGLALGLTLALAIGSPARLEAQDISESLSSLNEENGKLYIGPLSRGLAAALNSGFYHTAEVHDVLGFDAGFRVMGSFVPNDLDTFRPVLPDTITVEGRFFSAPYGPAGSSGLSPTVTGVGDGIVLVPQGEFRDSLLALGENPAEWAVRFPEGFDIPVAPYAAIQGALGIPLGTELVLRFIPSFTPSDDVGSISMIGGAIKHSLDQWIWDAPPLNLAVAFGFQHFKVGDYLDANSTQFSLIASKKLSVVTFYGAGTLENANLDISYEFEPDIVANVPVELQKIEFRQETPNDVTFKLGGTLAVGPVGLNAEYTVASRDVFTAALIFGTF